MRVVEALRSTSPSQLLMRVLILLGTLGFTASLLAAGEVQTWGLYVLAVMTALTMAAPHTDTGFIVILYLMAVWFSGVDDVTTAWTVPAALSLLLIHVACALAATAPFGARVPGRTLRRWGVRTTLVAGGTALAWAVSAGVARLDLPADPLFGVLAVALIAAAVVLTYGLTLRDQRDTRHTARRD